MADAFERDLSLMLDEPPALDGEDVFAAGIEARIEVAWRVRRWGLGLAALAGVGVSMAVLPRAHLGLATLTRLGEMTDRALSPSLAEVSRSTLQGGDATWLLAACLVALAAVVVPRLLAEV